MEISSRPVRKVVTRGAPRVNGYFASRKMDRLVPWEYQLERDFIVLAEVDPSVSAFYAQPLKTEYWLDGKLYPYFPDFAVEVDSTTEIHDVKPDRVAADTACRAHCAAAARVIEHAGYLFHLTTEALIHREPYFSNARQLVRCLHYDVDVDDELFLLDLLDTLPGLPIAALQDGRYGREIPLTSLYALLARGTILTDLGAPLSMMSPLTRTSRPPRLLPIGVRLP